MDYDKIGWFIVVDELVNDGAWWLMMEISVQLAVPWPGEQKERHTDLKRSSTNGGFHC